MTAKLSSSLRRSRRIILKWVRFTPTESKEIVVDAADVVDAAVIVADAADVAEIAADVAEIVADAAMIVADAATVAEAEMNVGKSRARRVRARKLRSRRDLVAVDVMAETGVPLVAKKPLSAKFKRKRRPELRRPRRRALVDSVEVSTPREHLRRPRPRNLKREPSRNLSRNLSLLSRR